MCICHTDNGVCMTKIILLKQTLMNLLTHNSSTPFVNQLSSMFSLNLKATFFLVGLLVFIGNGSLTAETSYTTCDDVTDGGTIAGDETGCNDPVFDPSLIVSTSPATGGSGALEYLWMSTTDDPNGVSAIWNIIPGSSGESFDPGPITQTTYYRRCSKREGCPIWIQESNTVIKEVGCNTVNLGDLVFNDLNGNGIQDAGEPGVAGVMVKLISAGPDGISGTSDDFIESTVTTDSNGNYLFVDVAAGTYVIEFMSNSLPDGFDFTLPNVGDDNNDSDANAIGQTDPFTIDQNSMDDLSFDAGITAGCDLEIKNITGVDPQCNPGTGIIALSIQGGTAPITYLWNNGATTEDLDGVPAGTYCVTITDANGCTDTGCATITGPDPITETVQITPTTCGTQNGSIDLSITGGTGPYTYLWNNGATSQDLFNLAAGTYCVVITDNNGCELNACYVVNSSNGNTVTVNPSNSTICPGETVTLTASGNGTYSWSATGGTFNTTTAQKVIYTMAMPGTYTITVQSTTSQGCTAMGTATVVVANPPSISGNANDATCGANNGSISTSVSSGTAPYTYAWNNGATTADLNNIPAGQYCVTVSDANGCIDTECFNVNNPAVTPVTVTPTNQTICPGESVILTASGASSYSWSATAGNLSSTTGSSVTYTMGMPGTYTITVNATDANGCASMANATVVVANPPSISGNANDATCGANNGSISTSVSSGTGPYTYAWSNGATTANLNNLPAGQYCVTVTDAIGCIDTECFNVNELGANPVTITPTNQTICPGETVTFTASGASSYSWSATGGVFNTTTAQTVIYTMGMPGTYTITVNATDANGCASMANATVVVANPPSISGNTNDATCGANNGSVSTSVSSGTGPYTYAWNNGATTANLNNLPAGQYCVTVTDAIGCIDTECFTLLESGDLSVSLDPMNPFCQGADNGMVTANPTYSGTGSLTYTWNTGATTNKISNLAAGTYCVTVTSTDGCEDTACTTLTAPEAVVADAIIGAAGCNQANGNIKLTVFGGTAPFTYKWDNGDTTRDIEGLAAGVYCVTICDALGCTFTGCFTVDGGVDFTSSISTTDATCYGGSDGSATVSPTGGSAPFTYLWNTGATTATINNLSPGNYCATVTDIFGCSAVSCADVSAPDPVDISIASTNTTCGLDNGTLSVSSTNMISSILWSNGATANTLSNIAAGTYSVTITNTNGCTASGSTTVSVSNDIAVDISPSNSTICPGEEVMLTGTSSLSPAVSYSWSATGGNLSSLNTSGTTYTMMMPGVYTITLDVQNAEGCTSSDQATITVRDPNDPICNPVDDTVNIGDYVWFDINNNGIQDPNELGVGGIDVKLMTAGPDGTFYTADDVTVDLVTTNAQGFYLFEDVAPGDYVIMFCLSSSDTEFTSQDTGGNDLVDSDANPANGKTDPFTVVAGQDDDLSFDAGIILPPSGCDNIIDGGEICCSQIICGANGPVDPITNVTSPSGGSGAIEYIWMSSTVGGAVNMTNYQPIPGATGPEYQPTNIFQTTFIVRCARRDECTVYKESNIIKLEVRPSPAVNIQSLPAFICVGETDDFNATSGGSGVTYEWDLGEGANPSTATGQHLTNISWSTPGTKIVTLTTTNQFCSATIERMVEVGSCANQSNDRFISIEALPVPQEMEVDLRWETNKNMNDFTFLIEHSADGENYEIIYNMEGKEAFENKNYSFLDENARPGRNYYRIKHINNNGRVDNSDDVMTIINDFQVDRFIVFPNPTQDYVIFESLKLTDEQGTIMISDMKGTILDQIVIPANTTRHTIDISNYPPGNYTFFIKYDDIRSYPRMINKIDK